MNSQLVIGTDDLIEFEVLKAEDSLSGFKKILRKRVNLDTLIKQLSTLAGKDTSNNITHEFNLIDSYKNAIAIYPTAQGTIVVAKLKEKKIRTFYNGKYYKLNHCQSIVILRTHGDRITGLSLWPYKVYQGTKTKVFRYPFPNTYANNTICIGSIDRTFDGDVEKAINNIIEGSYTHHHSEFSAKSELKETKDLFNYLSENEFPYHFLYEDKTVKDLQDILNAIKNGKII